jgi:GT2 family glycosyltransferase
VNRAGVEMSEEGITTRVVGARTRDLNQTKRAIDCIELIKNETKLTRQTIAEILTKAKNARAFVNNPERFCFEVIIIDNGSKIEQETSKIIKEEFLNNPEIKKKTTYIENENTGFGRGNNLGMKMAKGDYVLLLNPDTKLNTNTIQIMVDFMKSRPDVGISTCKLVKAIRALARSTRVKTVSYVGQIKEPAISPHTSATMIQQQQ